MIQQVDSAKFAMLRSPEKENQMKLYFFFTSMGAMLVIFAGTLLVLLLSLKLLTLVSLELSGGTKMALYHDSQVTLWTTEC